MKWKKKKTQKSKKLTHSFYGFNWRKVTKKGSPVMKWACYKYPTLESEKFWVGLGDVHVIVHIYEVMRKQKKMETWNWCVSSCFTSLHTHVVISSLSLSICWVQKVMSYSFFSFLLQWMENITQLPLFISVFLRGWKRRENVYCTITMVSVVFGEGCAKFCISYININKYII